MTRPWFPSTERREPAMAPPMGPLLAGARARGVADGLEWLGLAAILIDDRGEALHVNPGAVELMGETLFLENGRLRARDAAADLALRGAVRDALTLLEPAKVRLTAADGEIWAHVAPMPADADDPYQLLRAVVLLKASVRH